MTTNESRERLLLAVYGDADQPMKYTITPVYVSEDQTDHGEPLSDSAFMYVQRNASSPTKHLVQRDCVYRVEDMSKITEVVDAMCVADDMLRMLRRQLKGINHA